MADNFTAKDGNAANQTVAADEVTDGTLGTVKVQYVKLMDGTIDGTSKGVIGATGLKVDNSGNTQPVSGSVNIGTAPAAARTTDSISVAHATDAIMNGVTVLTPTFAAITASASGATTIVNLVSSKKIRVLALAVVCTSAVTVKLQSHTTTSNATGAMPFGANGGISLPFSPVGWFETTSGEALDINLGGAVVVGGQLVYVAV